MERKGTRCAVCVGCGRCFEPSAPTAQASGQGWSGKRCEVCVGCGECAKAWGLVPADDVDAVTGATNWAEAFKAMDIGSMDGAPPIIAPPGMPADDALPAAGEGEAPGNPVAASRAVGEGEPDAVTGATPGVATACKELGLDDQEALAASLGIKPPGVA